MSGGGFRGSRHALIALLLAGFPGTAPAAESPRFQVEGASAFSATRVARLIPPPEPLPRWDRLEWADWAQDASVLLREAYREQGYLDAEVEVTPVFSDSQPLATPRTIRARIAEGTRYRFGSVRLELASPEAARFDSISLGSRPGRPFDRNLLFRDRRELLRFYGDAGFLRARAAESLWQDFDRKLVDVVFRVDPGPALVFDTLLPRIHREGDTTGLEGKTRPSLLRSLFPLRPGDTLSLRELNAYERKLKSTRVYNFVRLRDSLVDSSGHARSALLLTAEEKVPGEMELSGYWETQYGLGTDLSWSHGNVGGGLHGARLGVTLAQRKQSFLAGYSAPLLFGTSVRFDNDFTTNWYQDNRLVRGAGWLDGDFDISNQSRLSRLFSPWMRGVSGAELFGKSETIDSGLRARDFNLNFLNSTYLHRLDDLVNPSRGARLAVSWGNGGPLLERQQLAVFRNRHDWIEAGGAAYLSHRPWLVIALRLDGGRFFGEGGINAPRFFLGGPRSIRSRDWRSVCPEVSAEGNCLQEGIEPAYVLGSAEIRLKPFHRAAATPGHLEGFQLVPFADYGNVWRVGRPLAEPGRGRAVGLGFRYGFLSLFNLRVDFAVDPEDPATSRWILDLAQAF